MPTPAAARPTAAPSTPSRRSSFPNVERGRTSAERRSRKARGKDAPAPCSWSNRGTGGETIAPARWTTSIVRDRRGVMLGKSHDGGRRFSRRDALRASLLLAGAALVGCSGQQGRTNGELLAW